DGASNTGVDDVREIRENVKFTPFRGMYRIYIIDEVHMLSNSAFNALLKTLEEPPAHVVFIFATTEIHKIPATILSRCQHYNFRRIPRSEIIQRLRHVAAEEGIVVEERSLAAIARASEGSMRDALSLLDQTVAFGGKTVRHDDLETLLGAVPQEHVRAMIASIIAQDSPTSVRIVAQLLDQGHDLRAYCSDLVEYVRNLLVAAVVPSPQDLRALIELSEEEILQVAADAKAFTAEELQELFRIFSQAEDGLRVSAHPRFVLEVAAVRATRFLLGARSVSSGRGSAVQSQSDTRRAEQLSAPTKPSAPKGPISVGQGSPTDRATTLSSEKSAVQTEQISSPSSSVPRPMREESSPVYDSTSARPLSRSESSPLSPPNADRTRDQTPPFQFNWEQVLERVASVHPNIAPFLELGTLVGVEGNLVTIGYPKTASVALARIQNEESIRVVADLCAELAGQAVRLRVMELGDGQPVGPSPAQLRAAKERDQMHVLLEQTRSHPLVKRTRDIFGAEVVEVRQVASRSEARE
ncbi:MAG TPA: DNA polymerase III subunit gamma/tau, partial [Nitrospiraceae bacterium]|nr:DNA polymerase III subunit gamma/tau [Nitrospiraceae bacterium]